MTFSLSMLDEHNQANGSLRGIIKNAEFYESINIICDVI